MVGDLSGATEMPVPTVSGPAMIAGCSDVKRRWAQPFSSCHRRKPQRGSTPALLQSCHIRDSATVTPARKPPRRSRNLYRHGAFAELSCWVTMWVELNQDRSSVNTLLRCEGPQPPMPQMGQLRPDAMQQNHILFDHLIAIASMPGGIARPSASAVLRLITSSNVAAAAPAARQRP